MLLFNQRRDNRPFWLKMLILALCITVTDAVMSSVTLDHFSTAIWVALLLTLLNATIKPLLVLLTIPLTVVSMGLFLLVINAIVILIASSWVGGFNVEGFWSALGFSIVLTVVSSLLNGKSHNSQGRKASKEPAGWHMPPKG